MVFVRGTTTGPKVVEFELEKETAYAGKFLRIRAVANVGGVHTILWVKFGLIMQSGSTDLDHLCFGR